MTTTKTTDYHYAIFCENVKDWQSKLGLVDWDIQLRHGKTVDALATTNVNLTGRVATIVFATVWPNDLITDERIKRVAVHEVLHVLLADIVIIGESRYISDSEMEPAEHAVIRRLEKVLVSID